eukprot:TRINITY_DN7959_c0_g1_i1.p1 TRINITY_DN7959_c0_g1~~TRINITY_DN7959_c0_g1_i1.p1  ORF type:complete len:215 (-),score=41.10 TRINITY_DN7959_c0_g1_i1:92-736(-)
MGNTPQLTSSEIDLLEQTRDLYLQNGYTKSSTHLRKKILIKFLQFRESFPDGMDITSFQNSDAIKKRLPNAEKHADRLMRLFNAFDKDKSGNIDFYEYTGAKKLFKSQSPADKIRLCFRALDVNADGILNREDIEHAVEFLFKGDDSEWKIKYESAERLTREIFLAVDVNNNNGLSCVEIIEFQEKQPELFKHLGLNLVFVTDGQEEENVELND